MRVVVLGLLVVLVLAGSVVYAVAVPHLREGDPVLTPHGERLARHARRRVRIAHRRTRVRVRSVWASRRGSEPQQPAVQERISR